MLADYSEFSRMVNEGAVRKGLLRGLMKLRPIGPAEAIQLKWSKVNIEVRDEELAWSDASPIACRG